ncbi:glycoside hydrolase family 95 protein [Edaphobacter dinghuensis]|nr:glycoside hydrolase family 95 protein [Edaphobacter dinghuensis]
MAFTENIALHNMLWYQGEAKRWLEALPIGNGRIGGMVFGGIQQECIALSESTAWSGCKSSTDINMSGLNHLQHIRELFFQGDYAQGKQLCEEDILSHPTSFGTNLPLLDLLIDFDTPQNVRQYKRSLDLDEGIAKVDYWENGHHYRRESFASNPDNVLVVYLTSDTPESLNFKTSFGNIKVPGSLIDSGSETIAFRGHAFETMHSNGSQGVDIEVHVQILHHGGTASLGEGRCDIRAANSAILLIAITTSYGGLEPGAACESALRRAAARNYDNLRQRHISDHQTLYRRVHLDLGSSNSAANLPTDQRRRAMAKGADDPELCVLFFQYGRYLTIAGSRANSPLPLALQGIWNDGLASSMGWTDDFHLDINTEQNYWLAEVGNLSESQAPLFALIEKLSNSGRQTAKELYGSPGWVSHVVTNPWDYTAPGWGLGWGIFVTSGIWIALQMWEHFRFTGDIHFLRDRAYPIFREAAEFFLAYMVQHPKYGWLVTGPSVSPENAFRTPAGGTCSESMGPTCDRVLVYALFSICLESQSLLSVDAALGKRIEQAQKKLSPLKIGKYGQLQEWLEDYEEAIPNHRHTTHLIALYPENQISPETTPDLAHAARVTLERRLNHADWEDTEWTRANFVNFYARLWDGEAAHKHLLGLLSNATEDNLLTYSRGGVAGASQNIFAIDGNTAGAAGIAEMLLQSQADSIHLLPALPSAWPDGSISGLCARGGFQVSLRWRSHRLVSVTISSRKEGNCSVRYGNNRVAVQVSAGSSTQLTHASFDNKRA